MTEQISPKGNGLHLRWTARVILLLWAAFWLFFAVADGIGDLKQLGPMALISQLSIAALIMAAVLVAWFAEFVGSLLLIACAVAFYFFLHVPQQIADGRGYYMLVIMVLPPLLAGVLLLVNSLTKPARKRPADSAS